MGYFEFSQMRARNKELNDSEFAEEKTWLESYPQVLFVELTENCNFGCDMCRAAGPFDSTKNMGFDLYRRIADELFPYAQIVDLRGWGESTILKSFPSFVDYAAQFGCRLRIVTNLSVMNDDLWRYLVELDFIIAVSFDASSPATFSQLRRGAKLDRILQNLQTMIDHCRKLGKSTEGIYLNVVIQSSALSEIEEILGKANNLGLQRVHLQPVSLPPSHPFHLSRRFAELATILGRVQNLADELGLTVVLGAALDDRLALGAYAAKTCIHPWMYCYVNYQGEVGFCDHLIGTPAKEYLIGDLRRNTFRDIWNSEKYRELRAQHVNWRKGIKSQFAECNWCYKNRYIDFDDKVYAPYQRYVVSNRSVPRLYDDSAVRGLQ